MQQPSVTPSLTPSEWTILDGDTISGTAAGLLLRVLSYTFSSQKPLGVLLRNYLSVSLFESLHAHHINLHAY